MRPGRASQLRAGRDAARKQDMKKRTAKKKTAKRAVKAVSPIEREAQTRQERGAILEARFRVTRLLQYAQSLHDYLHGRYGDPSLAEAVFKEADALRYAMNSAVAARLTRLELEKRRRRRSGA